MRILLINLLAILSLSVAGQSKFIEVSVSDTVMAKADLFVYQISVVPDEDVVYSEAKYMDTTTPEKQTGQSDKKLQNLYDSVVAGLTKAGFDFLSPDVTDKYSIKPNTADMVRTAYVLLKSAGALDNLYRRLQNIKNLSGIIIVKSAQDEERYKSVLLQKILNVAAARAKNIATMTGLSIGNIFSVTESSDNKNDAITGWIAYPPLSSLFSVTPGWHTTIGNRATPLVTGDAVSSAYIIGNTLTVRFSVQ